jgi:uncharacterized protein YndB with AHSA1/START domain
MSESAMPVSNVAHASFTLYRVLPAPPARVFAAFADPDLKRRWFADSAQHDVVEFTSDLREGAVERLRYRFREGGPFAGVVVNNVDTVLNLVADERILWASKMTLGDNDISAALMTAEMLPVDGGTELTLTFQGAFFEGSDGPEIREMGWKALLDRLAGVLG